MRVAGWLTGCVGQRANPFGKLQSPLTETILSGWVGNPGQPGPEMTSQSPSPYVKQCNSNENGPTEYVHRKVMEASRSAQKLQSLNQTMAAAASEAPFLQGFAGANKTGQKESSNHFSPNT